MLAELRDRRFIPGFLARARGLIQPSQQRVPPLPPHAPSRRPARPSGWRAQADAPVSAASSRSVSCSASASARLYQPTRPAAPESAAPGLELRLDCEGLAQLGLGHLERLRRRCLRFAACSRRLAASACWSTSPARSASRRALAERASSRAIWASPVALELLVQIAQPGPVGFQADSLVADRATALAEPGQIGGQRGIALAQPIEFAAACSRAARAPRSRSERSSMSVRPSRSSRSAAASSSAARRQRHASTVASTSRYAALNSR